MGAAQSGGGPKYNQSGEVETYTNESVETVTAIYTGSQIDTLVLAGVPAQTIEILGIYCSTNDKTTDVTIAFADGTVIFKLYTTNFTTAQQASTHIKGLVNDDLEITCGADTFIAIQYKIY